MSRSGKYLFVCAGLLLSGWLPVAMAEAHSIYIFAYPENSQICTNSYFGGKAKVRNGQVSMVTASGEVLATAKTDGQGNACFERPKMVQGLVFRVEASGGHQGEFKLPASDIWGGDSSGFKAGQEPLDHQADAVVSATFPVVCAEGLTHDDLNKALSPIMLKLAEMESEQNSRISPRDIVGGLGWLIGLAGAALWAFSRKNTAGTREKS